MQPAAADRHPGLTLKLAVKDQLPFYQGRLQLLSGPHRVEGGWWHRLKKEETEEVQTVYSD